MKQSVRNKVKYITYHDQRKCKFAIWLKDTDG